MKKFTMFACLALALVFAVSAVADDMPRYTKDGSVFTGAGMTAGTDFEFLPIGDGGPATAAFMRGDVSAYAASTADGAIMSQRGLKMPQPGEERPLDLLAVGPRHAGHVVDTQVVGSCEEDHVQQVALDPLAAVQEAA